MIKISVILPIYNVEKYLPECLDSIINQTLKEIEIICVNDGSPDKCLDIIKSYAEKDSRIVVVDQKNKGSGEAKNSGLKIAKGQFVIFMDPDDFYPKNDILESLYSAATENNVKIAGGELSYFFNDNYTLRQDFCESFDGQLFEKNQIINYKDYQFDYGYTRFIYDRKLLEENNINFPNFKNFEDPVFFVRAMQAAQKFYSLKKIVYAYRNAHKPVVYSKKRTYDTLCGLKLNLSFAKKNKLKKLKSYTIIRFEEYYERLEKTLNIINMFKFFQLSLLNKRIRKYFIKILLQNCFSIKNKKPYKIITILGIKIKFKSKYLKLRSEIEDLRNYFDWYKTNSENSIKAQIESLNKIININETHLEEAIETQQKRLNDINETFAKDILSSADSIIKLIPFKNKKIFLFGTSTHDNIGDAAIAEAEKIFAQKYFSDYQIIEVPTYEFDENLNFIKKIISPYDMVWCSGGGNLGSRYIEEELLRRKVVSYFPNNTMIIFPQSIYFSSDTYGQQEIQKSKEHYARNKNLVILTRDPKSFEFAKTYFPNTKSMLFPDIVCSYPFELNFDRNGILSCIRDVNDESGLTQEQYNSVVETIKNLGLPVDYTVNRHSTNVISQNLRSFIVNEQLKNFARHKIVITDRLHGLIFSIVTKTPCVVLKSEDHKIKEFMHFLKDLNAVTFIDTNVDELKEAANKMLQVKDTVYPKWDEYFRELASFIKERENKNV